MVESDITISVLELFNAFIRIRLFELLPYRPNTEMLLEFSGTLLANKNAPTASLDCRWHQLSCNKRGINLARSPKMHEINKNRHISIENKTGYWWRTCMFRERQRPHAGSRRAESWVGAALWTRVLRPSMRTRNQDRKPTSHQGDASRSLPPSRWATWVHAHSQKHRPCIVHR